MSVVAVLVGHVRHAQDIQLRLASPTRRIDWEKYRPCYAAADERNGYYDLEESKEQIPIQRRMVQDEGIWDGIEAPNPIEEALW